MADANGPSHAVDLTGLAREQFLALVRSARHTGREDEFADALETVLARLAREPFRAGEPLYELKKMRMQVRQMVAPPLYIEYGVHHHAAIVLIRHIGGLSPDDD